ncbi:MAG TPA: hypothetical protein VD763_13290 [Candidatus Saccharimonadales bacterium]|nr:hypothetical protein [Candidatus Saccharimonadales bacterium]
MDRTTRNLFAGALVVLVLVVGGAAILLSETTIVDPDAPPGTTVAVGVIVGVEAEGLGDVRSFALRTADGTILDMDLSALENSEEFPPGHLAEHQVTAEPVRVWYREEGGTRLAIRLADAES